MKQLSRHCLSRRIERVVLPKTVSGIIENLHKHDRCTTESTSKLAFKVSTVRAKGQNGLSLEELFRNIPLRQHPPAIVVQLRDDISIDR